MPWFDFFYGCQVHKKDMKPLLLVLSTVWYKYNLPGWQMNLYKVMWWLLPKQNHPTHTGWYQIGVQTHPTHTGWYQMGVQTQPTHTGWYQMGVQTHPTHTDWYQMGVHDEWLISDGCTWRMVDIRWVYMANGVQQSDTTHTISCPYVWRDIVCPGMVISPPHSKLSNPWSGTFHK